MLPEAQNRRISGSNWLSWLLIYVIYHLACQKAQSIKHHKAQSSFFSVNILTGKKIIIVLMFTLVSGLFIPESFADANNTASCLQFSYCTTAHYTIKMEENMDPATSAYTPSRMPPHIGTAAFCRGSLSDEWPEHHWLRKRLNPECNLRHASEINEAAPEMKHVYRCLAKSGPEKDSDTLSLK